MKINEHCSEKHVQWTIVKFKNQEMYAQNNAYDTSEIDGNVMLNEGINHLWTLACYSGTAFDDENSFLGVGDSSVAAAATQTGLQATTNLLYKLVDSGYPIYGSLQKATWQTTFNATEANFAWNEFTLSNGDSNSDVNLNRKVSSQGTKLVNEIWVLRLEITLA